eukprot:237852-Chlamydomonas_euryale.AAC.6
MASRGCWWGGRQALQVRLGDICGMLPWWWSDLVGGGEKEGQESVGDICGMLPWWWSEGGGEKEGQESVGFHV